MSISRSRWAAIGAAVAVTLGAGGGFGLALATGERSDVHPVVHPITPCRVVDTRSASQIGANAGPLGPEQAIDVDGRGSSGECQLPADAVGLMLNVTAVGATAQTNLRVYPADAPLPEASNLNPSPGAAPTPNAVLTALSDDGRFSVRNFRGDVHVVIDVNGYLVDHDHGDVPTAPASHDAYTKAEVDDLLADVARVDDVYDRADVDQRFGAHWVWIFRDRVQDSSPSLADTVVRAPTVEQPGLRCIDLPDDAPIEPRAAVAMIEDNLVGLQQWSVALNAFATTNCPIGTDLALKIARGSVGDDEVDVRIVVPGS